MLGFISTATLKTKANELVQEFARACPPLPRSGTKVVPEKTVSRALGKLYAEAAAFSHERRLGIFGRARFAKALQNEVRQLGYPTELVTQIVSAVTLNALVAPRQGKPE